MTFPTVHMNGDSKQTLLDQNLKATHAIRDAIDAMHEAAPNARNFYVQGEGAWKAARDEYSNRLRQLDSIRDELDAITQHIADS